MTESVGSGRKVRWGILATGGIAASFAEDLRELKDDAEIVAVGSRRLESARAFADRFGIPRAYGSWTELADDEGVDVVYVATPHSAHRVAAGLCLRAGRSVLCEKPFTVNAVEARELADLARTHGRFLMEAMWTYCNPVVRRLTELVADGAVGEVRSVHADFGLAGPFDPGHRLLDPALGGGALLDLGVYPVSFAHLLLGEPDEVQAWAHLTEDGVDDNTGMLLGYDSGAMAVLSCSSPPTPRRPRWSPAHGDGSRFRPVSSTRTASCCTARAASPRSSAPRTTVCAGCSTRRPRSCAACARASGSPRWCRWRAASPSCGRSTRSGTGSASATPASTDPRQVSRRPGSPASVTKDAAVVSAAPGVVTESTVLKSARASSASSRTVT